MPDCTWPIPECTSVLIVAAIGIRVVRIGVDTGSIGPEGTGLPGDNSAANGATSSDSGAGAGAGAGSNNVVSCRKV